MGAMTFCRFLLGMDEVAGIPDSKRCYLNLPSGLPRSQ